MKSVNKAILVGGVIVDPELKFVGQGNKALLNLRVATTEAFRKDDGTWDEQTEYHNVTFWDVLAERVAKQVQKGTQIYVEGQTKHRSYEANDGTKKYITEVKARDFMVLSRGKTNEDTTSPTVEKATTTKARGRGAVAAFDEQDDLPFN